MTDLKRLVFGKGLLGPTLAEDKEITIRKYRPESHDFQKDEIIRGDFMEGISILLKMTADTKVKTFHELTDEEAIEDGFKDAEDAFNGLKTYYPDLTLDDKCAIIRYEVPKINGINIACWNEFAE